LGKYVINHLCAATPALSHVEETLDPCDANLRYDVGLGKQGLPQGRAKRRPSSRGRQAHGRSAC
jgi:hypothetical protein